QIKYLHNSVLLPKVGFRLKTSVPSKRECKIIMAPMKRVFKNSLGITSRTPDSFLLYGQALGLQDLFEFNLTNHLSHWSKITSLGAENPLTIIFQHRLFALQRQLHIPFSPTYINNFSAFSKLPVFQTDYLFRLLAFSSNTGIRFSEPLPPTISYNVPLYELFNENPSLYKN